MIPESLGVVGMSVLFALSTYTEFYYSLPGAVQVVGAAFAVCVIVRFLLRPILGDEISSARSDIVKKRNVKRKKGRGK